MGRLTLLLVGALRVHVDVHVVGWPVVIYYCIVCVWLCCLRNDAQHKECCPWGTCLVIFCAYVVYCFVLLATERMAEAVGYRMVALGRLAQRSQRTT